MAPRKARGSRDTLKAFTERAMEAVDTDKLIPPIVYLPRRLRGHKITLTEGDLKLDIKPPDIIDNHVRIAALDPIGMLGALMNGQPIPAFNIQDDGSIRVEYEVAPLAMRQDIAKFLTLRITMAPTVGGHKGQQYAKKAQAQEFDTLIKNRAQETFDAENV